MKPQFVYANKLYIIILILLLMLFTSGSIEHLERKFTVGLYYLGFIHNFPLSKSKILESCYFIYIWFIENEKLNSRWHF